MPHTAHVKNQSPFWLGRKKQYRCVTGDTIKYGETHIFGQVEQPGHHSESDEDDQPITRKMRRKMAKDNETVENDRHKEDKFEAKGPKTTRATPPFKNY